MKPSKTDPLDTAMCFIAIALVSAFGLIVAMIIETSAAR